MGDRLVPVFLRFILGGPDGVGGNEMARPLGGSSCGSNLDYGRNIHDRTWVCADTGWHSRYAGGWRGGSESGVAADRIILPNRAIVRDCVLPRLHLSWSPTDR